MTEKKSKKHDAKPFQFTVIVFFLCAGAVFFYYYTRHQRMTELIYDNTSADKEHRLIITRTAPGFLSINKYLFRLKLMDNEENIIDGKYQELARADDVIPDFDVRWHEHHLRVFDGDELLASCIFKNGKQQWLIPRALAHQESLSPDGKYLVVIKYQGSPEPEIIPAYYHFFIYQDGVRVKGPIGKLRASGEELLSFNINWGKDKVFILENQTTLASATIIDKTQNWSITANDKE